MPKRPRSEQNAPPSASRPTSRGSGENLSHAPTVQRENATEPDNDGASGAHTTRGGELRAGEGSVLRSPARRLGTKRAPTIPKPRPLPPPVPEEDEEILNPFARGGLRRSPLLGADPEPVVPEPELPPTPEHPDPVVSTPPSGIHNTPSRRPKRSKALAEKLKSSSPLKNPPITSSPSQDAPPVLKLPSRPSKPSKLGISSQPTDSQGPTTAQLRGIKSQDADAGAERKALRDSLLAEVADLERDLAVMGKENERLSDTDTSQSRISPLVNGREILDILRRYTLPPEKKAEPEPARAWLQSALDPIAFLPFGKPAAALPALFVPPDQDDDGSKTPVSHHPLPMTAEEALPFLQVFTPLAFTSHISTIPNPESSSSLLQRHSISATSSAPGGLFSAGIDMTVDTRTMAVVDLAVPRLEPAAVSELTPLIDRVTTKTQPLNSALSNNVSVLAWAMAEWLKLATHRAKVWATLERELAGKKEALQEMMEQMRVRRQRQKGRRRRRGRNQETAEEDDEDGDEGHDTNSIKSLSFGAAELRPFMGRMSMDFEIPLLLRWANGAEHTSTLRVQWRIGFDWTGEAKSEVGVLVGVPGKCKLPWVLFRCTLPTRLLTSGGLGHKCDERGRLSGIPKLFDELIRGGEEPLDAVRTVACLLAGEQRS